MQVRNVTCKTSLDFNISISSAPIIKFKGYIADNRIARDNLIYKSIQPITAVRFTLFVAAYIPINLVTR